MPVSVSEVGEARVAVVLGVLALGHAGDTWGLGRWWRNQAIVARRPLLV